MEITGSKVRAVGWMIKRLPAELLQETSACTYIIVLACYFALRNVYVAFLNTLKINVISSAINRVVQNLLFSKIVFMALVEE
jgi:hypothetical protein